MDGDLKLLILTGRPRSDDANWPDPALLDRLEQRGVRVQVLCPSRAPALASDARVLESPLLANRWLRGLAVRRLYSEGRLKRPDLIHLAHDEMVDVALAMSESREVPYVQTVAGFRSIDRGLRLSRRWCRQLVVSSVDLARDLVRELGVGKDRIVVIPPGLPPQHESGGRSGTWNVPVIGAGGPHEESSGLSVFLKAAHLVVAAGYDVEFIIAGHTSQQSALRYNAQRLQIADRVTLADYPGSGPELWSALDFFCQPALKASSGRTLIQALARALPCIASDVKGLRDLIDSGENGLLVPPGDPTALKEAMLALLDQPELTRRYGQNALETARSRFDLDSEAARLTELYRKIASPADQPTAF
jgi:glycosyltransferase involved in cell wall biosynthesis